MKIKLIVMLTAMVCFGANAQWTGTNPHTLNDNAYINGKAGIGTTFMSAMLNIQRSQTGLSAFGAPITSYTTGLRITHRFRPSTFSSYTNYTWDIAADYKRLHFYNLNSGQTHMSIGTNGNVSIGTGAASDKLNVLGFTRIMHNGLIYLRIGADATNSHIDFTGPGKLMINTTSGNDTQFGGEVQACLVRTSEVVVESGWCDYVFEDDYELRTIEELKAYIDQNKHLPNVTPATQVESTGLEMADMQRRMMEKIEELSLYVIQLNDQIKEQQATIEELKKNQK